MSLVFYYSPMSTASITELVLEELGVPFERVKLDLRAGDNKKPEYLKINPNGRVPALVHDGMALWESSALTMYLGETFGVEKGLYPALGLQRGEAMKWIVWANVTLGDAVHRWSHNTSNWAPPELQNAKAGEVARKDIDTCLGILDQALSGRSFLLGQNYSLADTHLFSLTTWLGFLKIDLTPFEHIGPWIQRCSARPAFARISAA